MDQDLSAGKGNLCRTSLSSIHSAAGRKPRGRQAGMAAIHLVVQGAVRLPPAVGENGPQKVPVPACRSRSTRPWQEPSPAWQQEALRG